MNYISDMSEPMQTLAEHILAHAATLPEGQPLAAKGLLHLGERAAVDQALSRLVKRGRLLRAGRGLYVLPVQGRYGERPPTIEALVERLSAQGGETVVRSGAAAANQLGLTTQTPIRQVYLTSGRSRRLQLGKQSVELRHAPPWQLVLPHSAAGEAVRALAWLGPEQAGSALKALRRRLPRSAFEELVGVGARLPTWLARSVSLAAHG
nr:DUF6088 family protein [Brevundimonas diminuta]